MKYNIFKFHHFTCDFSRTPNNEWAKYDQNEKFNFSLYNDSSFEDSNFWNFIIYMPELFYILITNYCVNFGFRACACSLPRIEPRLLIKLVLQNCFPNHLINNLIYENCTQSAFFSVIHDVFTYSINCIDKHVHNNFETGHFFINQLKVYHI